MSHDKVTIRLLAGSLLIGLGSGLIATLYRWVLSNIDVFRTKVLLATQGIHLIFAIFSLFLLAYGMHRLLQWAPYSGGSGIPQIRAELGHHIAMEPMPTMLSKFVGGSLGNVAGLTLGREGPSIQLGGMVGKILSHLGKVTKEEQNAWITAGACAGLSAAFNAPISGVLFALEEMHKSFSPWLLVPCFGAALVANTVSFALMGMEPAFDFRVLENLPLAMMGWVIALGLGMGVLGFLFSKGLLFATRKIKSLPIPRFLVIFSIMLLVFGIGRAYPLLLGGGHSLIEAIANQRTPLQESLFTALGLLIVRLLLVWLCYGSGAQGGIFLPILTVGALGGFLFFLVQSQTLRFLDSAYLIPCLYLGMVGVLTAVVQSPFMCILLVTEMSGSIHVLLPFATCAIVSYCVARAMGAHPVYEDLYDASFSTALSYPQKKDNPRQVL